MTQQDAKEAARQAVDILLGALSYDIDQLDNFVERLRNADLEEFRTRLLAEHALKLGKFLDRYPQPEFEPK